MITIEEFAQRAIDVPFKPHGRDWDAWDCWGLIYVAYKEVMGIELPRYDRDYTTVKDVQLLRRLFRHGIEKYWTEVDTVQPCDGIMYYATGETSHVGLAVTSTMMLHTEHGIGTTYEEINTKLRRTEGIYRYGK